MHCLKSYEIIEFYIVFILASLLLSFCLPAIAMAEGRVEESKTDAESFIFDFRDWARLDKTPSGWKLKNGIFPSKWEVSGLPGAEGEIEQGSNPPSQQGLYGNYSLNLTRGRMLSKNITLAAKALEGKVLDVSVAACGQGGSFSVHLREYSDDGKAANDNIDIFATIIDKQRTGADWKEYLVRAKTRGRSFRLDVEGEQVVIGGITATLRKDEKTLPKMRLAIPLSPGRHSVDGRVSDEERAVSVGSKTGFMNIGNQKTVSRQSEYLLSSDGERLFIACLIPIPKGGLKQSPGGAPWENESLEIYINPTPEANAIPAVYKIAVDTLGAIYSERRQESIGVIDSNWTCKGVEAAVGRQEATPAAPNGFATLELAIPLDEAGIAPNVHFGLNLCRNIQTPGESADIIGSAYRDYGSMCDCVISKQAPAMSWGYKGDGKTGCQRLFVDMANPTGKPQSYMVKLQVGERIESQSCELAPGALTHFVLDAPINSLKLKSVGLDLFDGERRMLASQWAHFDALSTATRQLGPTGMATTPVEFYPIQKKINIRLRNLANRMKAIGVREYGSAEVFVSQGESLLLHKTLDSLQIVENTGHISVQFDPPGEGRYQVKAVLRDRSKPDAVVETITGEFESRRLEWLNNGLGKDRIVIPPFTPISVNGGIASCWGRSYKFNGSGLPASLNSQGKEMLAGAMRFVLQDRDGLHQGRIDKDSLIFEESAQDRIRFKGETVFPSAIVRLKGQMEYDGMIRYETEIEPRGSVDIERLSLHIPMRDMRYLTWMGGIRSDAGWAMMQPGEREYRDPNVQLWSPGNFHNDSPEIRHDSKPLSLYLPRTEGVIWSSLGWRTKGVYGNFLPAVTFGNFDYGLGWFADSDRGWINDAEHPCFELTRQGDACVLNINFIAKSATLKESRKIVFGILATPVRPRVTGGDLAIKLRCRGGSEYQFLKQYQGLVYQEPYLAKRMRDSHKSNGNASAIYIGNAFPVNDPATKACLYEWGDPTKLDTYGEGNLLPFLFYGPDVKNYVSIQNCRYSSVIDYQMSCLGKDMELGLVDGVYFDNSFPVACSNIQHERCGYIRDDGRLQAGFHIFETWEFARRVATLSYTRHCLSPRLTVHMTSALMPVLCSFADVYFDGEWTPASMPNDFIDYVGQPYLEGFAAGGWGGNAGWLPCRAVTRQMLAALKLYDLWIFMGRSQNPFVKDEERFGVLAPDCRFIGYWRKGEGAIEGMPPEIKASCYLRPGKGAIAYVSNFGKQPKDIVLPCNQNGWNLVNPQAEDIESKKSIPISSGKIAITVGGHDFRAIKIENTLGQGNSHD